MQDLQGSGRLDRTVQLVEGEFDRLLERDETNFKSTPPFRSPTTVQICAIAYLRVFER